MDNHSKFIILIQIPIFIIGIILVARGVGQQDYWLAVFDFVVGIFNMIFAITITISNIRDMIRGRY